MTRAQILAEIVRTTADNRGVPIGQTRFSTETGIKKLDWYGKYWARWSDALTEAGLQPNRFVTARSEDDLLSKLAGLTRDLGHLPVEGELKLRARSDPEFPDHSTLRRRFGPTKAVIAKLRQYALQMGLDDVAALCGSAHETKEDTAEASPSIAVTIGFVYLIRSGRFYKIGRSNSVGRRERELAIQLPEKTRLVHSIKTDDPVGIEEYWHKRFDERRKNGEWFELTAADLGAFKRRKFQ